ncbi:MAG: hypothetical protein PHC51_03350 [bacterium]|nr:hypothetical protein [bacterium]
MLPENKPPNFIVAVAEPGEGVAEEESWKEWTSKEEILNEIRQES